MNCTSSLYQHLYGVLHNSGRSFFHRGHYQDCLDQPALKYSLVELASNGTDTGIYTGLCIPRACPDSYIGTYLNDTLVSAGSPLYIYEVRSDTQNYETPLDWTSYLTIILFSSFLLLTLFSTLKRSHSKDKKSSSLLIESFDLNRNMSHFKIRQNESLNIMDGVRALAMMWVVFGHTYFFYFTAGVINFGSIADIASSPYYLLVEAGMLSVDVFFWLGGFFLAFIMLREHSSLPKYLLAVPQRALRIWPAYIMAMLFYLSLFMQTGSGPTWYTQKAGPDACLQMWKEIFFYSNMVSAQTGMCLGWGWYLQVDFQLFIAGLLLLIVYKSYPKVAVGLSGLLAVASMVFVFVYTLNKKVRIFSETSALTDSNQLDYFLDVYQKPWGRCSPYLLGLVFGMFYMSFRSYEKKKERTGTGADLFSMVKTSCQSSVWFRRGIEWTGIALMSFVAFIPRTLQTGHHWQQSLHSMYYSLSKPIFIFGLILTVLPSTLGVRGSFFDFILTNRLFSFIARVSFCTYLVHLFIMIQFYGTRNFNIMYNTVEGLVIHCAMLVMSLTFGFVATMTIELPFANLQKHLVNYLLKGPAKKVEKHESKVSLLTASQSFSREQSEAKLQKE